MIKKVMNITLCLVVLFFMGCVEVDPTTLEFGLNETTKYFTLTVSGPLEWSIDCDKDWVTVDPDSGQWEGESRIKVTIDRTELDTGTYDVTLNISTKPKVSCPDVTIKVAEGIPPSPLCVEGYVYDDSTNDPIPDVLVSIGAETYDSDNDGYYFISVFTEDTYIIRASKYGFQDYWKAIYVDEEDCKEHDIYMIPESTSTTTTVCSPDPVVYEDSPDIRSIYNSNDVCIGIELLLNVENKGCAGEIYFKLTSTQWNNDEGVPYSDCVVTYMDEGEKRFVGPFNFDDIFFCNQDIDLTFRVETRNAIQSDFPECKKGPLPFILSPENNSDYIIGESITDLPPEKRTLS